MSFPAMCEASPSRVHTLGTQRLSDGVRFVRYCVHCGLTPPPGWPQENQHKLFIGTDLLDVQMAQDQPS